MPGRHRACGRADVEVTVDVLHVDIEVHSALRAIDQHRNAARMRDPTTLSPDDGADAFDMWYRDIRVRA